MSTKKCRNCGRIIYGNNSCNCQLSSSSNYSNNDNYSSGYDNSNYDDSNNNCSSSYDNSSSSCD